MLWVPVTLLALFASAQGRAVNISNTWVLPEEGFPVFYRYFRDRISWYEADAVCQFHHANLVTVDTTAQYDAVRAYLKELDISSAVWVGLIRSNPDGDFTWTDYRGLSSEGYWSSAPDARAAPLCAAADPAADYRWEARACGGPTVASFICELPVPQWALGNDGCMVRALPALTVLYLPESAAVQLTADCGLAGVKRVQCTGNVKREELLKELSCSDEEDISSTMSLTSTSTVWSVTDTPTTDEESTSDEESVDETVVTEYNKDTSNTQTHFTETPTPYSLNNLAEERKSTKQITNNYIKKPFTEDLNLERTHSDNIISNDIPHQDNTISLQKLDDNQSLKHRLLHDEMTRLENVVTIFTQPTDHFVPPLVMAKARISDDMTVLSLKEKYAQQIAEQQLLKHNNIEEPFYASTSETANFESNELPTIASPATQIIELTSTSAIPIQTLQNDSVKKDVKSSVPKKYTDKYNNIKGKLTEKKLLKTIDIKPQKAEKKDVSTAESLYTTTKIPSETGSEEDSIIDLTVIIKEPGAENSKKIFYSNHSNSVSQIDLNKNMTDVHRKSNDTRYPTSEKPIFTTNSINDVQSQTTPKVTLNHEIIKITVINDHKSSQKSNPTPIVFEISTMIPVLSNDTVDINDTTSASTTTSDQSVSTESATSFSDMSTIGTQTVHLDPVTVSNRDENHTPKPQTTVNNGLVIPESKLNHSNENIIVSTKNHQITTEPITTVSTAKPVDKHISEKSPEKGHEIDITSTTAIPNIPFNITEIFVTEKADVFNHTVQNEEDHEEHETEVIEDYQSPLLSAANEPLHRPSRSRRPQPPPNRLNKFNPFRILG